MTFKNSMKILSSNFSLCWKQLAWILISLFVTFGLACLIAMPVFTMLKNEGFFVAAKDMLELFYTSPKDVPAAAVDVVNLFFRLVAAHAASGLVASYIGVILVLIICISLCRCIGLFTCCSVLDSKMASNAQMGYCSRLVSCLGKSVACTFAYMLISIPFWAVLGVAIWGYATLAKNLILTIALLPVLMIVVYMLLATKLALFANMMPQMVVEDIHNPFVAFAKGVKISIGRFWRTFSNAICLLLVIGVVNLFVGVFTLSAGLLVTIPATTVLLSAFYMVSFYQCTGRSFYVSDTIVVSLK